MSLSGVDADKARADFDRCLGELRPKLHRYCARMTGSVIDGEDVIQEALVKAIKAFPEAGPIADLEGWLFRVTHNAALDFLRRRRRHEATHSDEELEMIATLVEPVADRQAAAASLRTFMRLPVAQRSSVILMDVLGYSLDDIGSVMGTSIPAVKAALHRGRKRLRELAKEPDDLSIPVLAEPERSLLAEYVNRFNARDFDAIRDMLANEVRLELVNKTRMAGRGEVGKYFHNYAGVDDWHFVPGLVDRRPALLVRDPRDPSGAPAYFVLLQWRGTSSRTSEIFAMRATRLKARRSSYRVERSVMREVATRSRSSCAEILRYDLGEGHFGYERHIWRIWPSSALPPTATIRDGGPRAFAHAGSIAFSASNCSRTAKSNILNMSNVEGLGAIRDDDTKKFPRCSRVLAGLGELRKHRPYVRHFDPIDFVR